MPIDVTRACDDLVDGPSLLPILVIGRTGLCGGALTDFLADEVYQQIAHQHPIGAQPQLYERTDCKPTDCPS